MSEAREAHQRRVDAFAQLTREERTTITVAFANTDGVTAEGLHSRATLLSAIRDANIKEQ